MGNLAYLSLFVILLSVLEITSRTLLKKSYKDKKTYLIFVCVILYLIVITLLYYSMSFGKFITVSALWDAGTIILATLSSLFILKEKITSGEFFGLFLIISGVVVMGSSTMG